MRHLLLGPVAGTSRAIDTGLLLLRLVAGLSLAVAHGISKLPPSSRFVERVAGMGLPAPDTFAWLAGFAELGGGLLLALGLLTRPAALFVAGNFVFIIALAHAGDPFDEREKPLLFLAIALLFLFTGPGRFSLDAMLFGGRRATPPGSSYQVLTRDLTATGSGATDRS